MFFFHQYRVLPRNQLNEIGLCLFFISRSSSFSVIRVNVKIKNKAKEIIGFVVVVFYL